MAGRVTVNMKAASLANMKRPAKIAFMAAFALGCLLAAPATRAQDLEPRAYAPIPMGANFFIANYTYQSGEVLFDPRCRSRT